MTKPIVTFQDYMPAQMHLEEKYYDELQDVIAILIAQLLTYIEDEDNITLMGVWGIYNRFISHYAKQIEYINNKQANNISELGYATYRSGLEQSEIINVALPLPLVSTSNLLHGLNIKTANLMDTIRGRFLELIPIGIAPISYLLFTDESTKEDIIRRSNANIKHYVQSATTEAVVSVLMYQAMSNGATEYIGDNMHDDKVRYQHAIDNDGETWHSFNNPPPSGIVGSEWNCRCKIKSVR